jgi:hypothetical protein
VNLDSQARAGLRVLSGPSGTPPTGMRSNDVAAVNPSLTPGLRRPRGSSVAAADTLWLKYGAGDVDWMDLAESLGAQRDLEVVSGEAIAVGNPLVMRTVDGAWVVKKAGATAGVGPFNSRGIAVTPASAAGQAVRMRVMGVTPVIPDALWETFMVGGLLQGGVPAASRWGQVAYLGKTAGMVTWYREGGVINPEAGDSHEALGWLYSAGPGQCRIMVFPAWTVLFGNTFSGYGSTVLSVAATVRDFTAAGQALAVAATAGHWKMPTCPGVPTGVPVSGEGSQIIDSTTGKLWRYHSGAWVDKG